MSHTNVLCYISILRWQSCIRCCLCFHLISTHMPLWLLVTDLWWITISSQLICDVWDIPSTIIGGLKKMTAKGHWMMLVVDLSNGIVTGYSSWFQASLLTCHSTLFDTIEKPGIQIHLATDYAYNTNWMKEFTWEWLMQCIHHWNGENLFTCTNDIRKSIFSSLVQN